MASAAEETPAIERATQRMALEVDLAYALRALEGLGERFAQLVAAIPNRDAGAHGLEWTVTETAVHVLTGLDYYSACIRGSDFGVTPRAADEPFDTYVARENRAQIDAEPERDPRAIAARLRSSLRDLIDAAAAAGPDATADFAAGYSEDTTTSVCTTIGELIVHGYDIARTTRSTWEAGTQAAVLAVYATTASLGLALDREAAAGEDIHVRIRLRHGASFSIRIRDGRVWTEISDERPDATVWAHPLAYLLVGYGRDSLLRPALRGQLLVWGRKPWVMLKVPKLFLNP
jgi:uncharacterized protein (TIGR03083 family)